jgi:hypothetical protein
VKPGDDLRRRIAAPTITAPSPNATAAVGSRIAEQNDLGTAQPNDPGSTRWKILKSNLSKTTLPASGVWSLIPSDQTKVLCPNSWPS